MRILVLAMLVALGACFEAPKADISFRCGPAGECPGGYECRDDGCCHLPDSPAGPVCAPIDAGDNTNIDAPNMDAREPTDATPDATPADAAPDAAPADAAPDAGT